MAVLLVAIWSAVLVPPVVGARQARRLEFEESFGRRSATATAAQDAGGLATGGAGWGRNRSAAVQRRRRIAGGLLLAVVATGLAGVVPSLRVLWVVCLFMVDSLLFYVALLAWQADRTAWPARGLALGGEHAHGEHAAGVGSRRRRPPEAAEMAGLSPVV